MQNTILILIGTAMVITTIVNFAKPGYKDLVGKWETTINIALSFALGICSAFAIRPYLEFDLGTGALILVGLALGTGANIFYDIWSLIQGFGSKIRKKDSDTILIELPDEKDEQD